MNRNEVVRREIIDSESPLRSHGLGRAIKYGLDGEERSKAVGKNPPGRRPRVIVETRFWERVQH